MNPELRFHLKSLTRLVYFVTEEEDRFLLQLQEAMKEKVSDVKVWSSTMGLNPLANTIQDWSNKAHKEDKSTMSIHDALMSIYRENTPKERKYYVILDPERWLKDPQVQRRFLNILHQCHNDIATVKGLICVSNAVHIPSKLSRYTEVIYDNGLTSEEIREAVEDTCSNLKMDVPEEPEKLLKGLTSFEIQASLIQSFKKTKGHADPKALSDYRLRQLKKTDLIKLIDVSKFNFDQVGGLDRLKVWVNKAKAAWTKEGQAFGLKPPKGLLAVGIWGCGKSLSVKCLGNAWGLPVIQLDLGRLRSSGVGDSEENTYRVCRLAEAAAPCILWIDEAEKSLSGGASSAYTDAGTTSRMIGALSTWIQETDADVCLALTANSCKTLPVEFVNRMDVRWFFDLPSLEDRVDILKIHLEQQGQDPSKFNLSSLAEAAQATVGREIEQCIKEAMLESFSQGKQSLDEEVLLRELRSKPRIVRTMTDEINETLDWVGYDRDVDDGVRARYAADPKGQSTKLQIG